MRITRDQLLNLARENAEKMSAKDRGMVCIYLTGSLIKPNPFIGGITDIDLVCVHDRPITVRREIVRINIDVHLDVAHYTQDDFHPARKLRTDAWIGGALDGGAVVLKDTMHWFDLTRSNAISQYWQPINVAARAGVFAAAARQNWMALREDTIPHGIKRVQALLDIIRDTANAAAAFTGMPLPIRRLFIELPEKASKIELPDLTGELVQVFTGDVDLDEKREFWLAGWSNAFEALKNEKNIPAVLNPLRRSYYEKALETLFEERPAAALWILLRTWTQAAAYLPKSEEPYKEWQHLCKDIGLEAKKITQNLDSLDATLERIEERLESIQN